MSNEVRLDSIGEACSDPTIIFLDASCYEKGYCEYDDILYAVELFYLGRIRGGLLGVMNVLQTVTREKKAGNIDPVRRFRDIAEILKYIGI